mmetsp:Transcript_2983/g.6485  ORF Transcript_2983/g.6485 Transcript_2983/m.6485 type:complete len:376 (+) Transcript_2983:107-1234(+)
MSSSSIFLKPRNVIALTASVASSGFYLAYRSHDRRAISESEVVYARGVLAQITPLLSSTSASSTANSHDSLAAQHLYNLTRCGVTIVRDTLSPPQLIEWNTKTKDTFDGAQNIAWQSGRAYYNITKRSVHYSDMAKIGCCCDDVDDANHDTINETTNSSWLGAFWRRRRKSNNSTENTTTLPKVSLQDVVQSYFEQHGIKRYMLTDIQFLNAYPKSTNQIWHRDNTFQGLTAIVALKDVSDNGPTELILGSHKQSFSLWPKCLNVIQNHLPSYFKQDGVNSDDSIPDGSIIGCIDAGDTLLYDARTFHRGRGNNIGSKGEGNDVDRPVLVIRWDAARTPPPGAGLIVTTANEYIGSMMYAVLFALQKISTTSGDR